MTKKKLKVGLETDFLNGPMTGVGNYCFHLLKAMLEQNNDVEFLAYSIFVWRSCGLLDLVEIAKAQLKQSGSNNEISSGRKARIAVRSLLAQNEMVRVAYRRLSASRFRRSNAVKSLNLFHAFRFVPPWDIEIPVLPVVYDLSFVRYPGAHPTSRLKELSRLGDVLHKARFIQTISHFSKREISEVYGALPERIVVAPPAARDIFRPLGDGPTRQDIVGLDLDVRQYLLAVGTLEPRKNLKTLIAAYSRLTPALRKSFPLVIVGHKGWGDLQLPPASGMMIQDGSLRFLGSVPDAQLRSLYEGAVALLFPSIYEGFGMPAVEALACGTQVAHSSGTSMDEITNEDHLRAPAVDVEAWTKIIWALLDDVTAATKGRDQRRMHSQKFSWAQSAQTVLRIYDQLNE